VNWPQLNVPSINAAMARANRLVDPAARSQAWAQVNRMITSQAPAIAWSWDERPSVESSDVRGVIALAYGTWDLAFTSLRHAATA
jgi:ABC-type transport system substrate-binding protein